MSTLLYIEDQLFDIDPKTNVGINSQVNDIAELKDRQCISTNGFKGLPTENNHKILEYANRNQSTTLKPYNRIEAKLEVDGTPYKGYIILNKVSTGYDLAFYGGAGEFFKIIEGMKLADLDLSSYDLLWDWTNMNAKYGSATSPTFFIVDDGNLPVTTKEVDVSQQYFSLYIKDIFQKIITEAGYTYEGGLFTDAKYLNAILPFTNKAPINKDSETDPNAVKATYTPLTDAFTAMAINPPFGVDFDTEVADANSQFSHSGTYSKFEPGGTYKCTIDVSFYFEWIKDNAIQYNSWPVFVWFVKEDALGVKTKRLMWANGSIMQYSLQHFAGELYYYNKGDPQVVHAGEKYYVEVQSSAPISYFVGNGSFEVKIEREIVYGDLWRFSDNMPDISQKDFIKAIMQMLCVIVDSDGIDKILRFEHFEILNDNKPDAIRIDPYIDHSLTVEREYHPTSYAQKNYLRYKEDENVTEFLGDAPLLINDNTLATEKTLFTLPFAATDVGSQSKLIGADVWEVLRTKDGSDVTPQPRILLTATKFHGVELVDSMNLTSTDLYYAYFIDYNQTHNLDFESLIADYYGLLDFMLNNYCKIVLKCLFDANFMNGVDHFIPLYSDIYNCYLYLNKITGYVKGRPTPTEVIRI